ncbi:PREDICTED: protein RIK-like isoform X2 [Camelina sativa]|uniref:Protein RIK-like isoform X2 n=1 Tax=Camelina sativa TaxID=90675 RepID=A0ABM0YLU6_CAMSA|nr:PREDICTED: protein RIK-like isoform X2 [Camelina sativa]
MTGDNNEARVSPSDSATSNDASRTRQRRKRKWDQPAEQLVAAGVAFPQLLSLGNNTLNVPAVMPLLQTLNQSKIQDELIIAREIVINDAEASLRHKLTKRSTQEEIQRCTDAVVITRGKYRPPNAPPDGEKPLYLHISAAAHLKETTERILAVDRAAAMIEEMMKHKSNSQVMSVGLPTAKMHSTCVYLGFEADPSSNVAARIRGPNDQYINHIMNETGATVGLRGRGSGSLENQHGEDAQLPLHILLSSSNPKSIDNAKRLAENLMDTISVEFGASRVTSSKLYGAVPPPQQLLSGAPGSEKEQWPNLISTCGLMTSIPITAPPKAVSPFPVTPSTSLYPQFPIMQPLGISNGGHLQPSPVSYLQPMAGGTSYSGYAGIYPQATPLQQVAQVLKQSISPVVSTVPPTMLTAASVSNPSDISSTEKERRPPQKRKFQELPADCKVPAKPKQLELAMSGEVAPKNVVEEPSANRVRSPPSPRSVMPPPPPKTLTPPPSQTVSPLSSISMLPPPPPSKTASPLSSKSMLPPPPRLTSTTQPSRLQEGNHITVMKPNPVPDTLIKLMEYGDDEDDDDDPDETLTVGS